MKEIEISWYRGEEFSATVEVDDDFDPEGDEADEALLEIVNNMTELEIMDAYDGCPDLEIRSKEWVDGPESKT